jgi:hypothetical protein
VSESTTVTVSEDEIVQDPQAPDAPDLIAGKFKTQDDLVKAYKELESKLGAPKAEAPTEQAAAPERTDGTIDTTTEKTSEATTEAKPFSLAEAAEELSEKGEISAESYAKLEAKGLSKADVDMWAEGIRARSTRLADELRSEAGGPEAFNQLLQWARTGMSAEEVQAYNDAVNGGQMTVAKMLLRSMRAAYETKNGRQPNLVGGENVPQHGGVKPFASQDQMVKAMSDIRYREDPNYRAEVDRRLAISDF